MADHHYFTNFKNQLFSTLVQMIETKFGRMTLRSTLNPSLLENLNLLKSTMAAGRFFKIKNRYFSAVIQAIARNLERRRTGRL